MTSALEIARDESLERFRSWLRSRNLPATPQRLAIATVVLGADQPLAAEDVVERLRAQGPAPSTATVYRTIDVLIECGLVLEEDRREGFRRFHAVRDDVSTEEFLCTVCGAVTPVRIDGAAAGAAAAGAAAAAQKAGFVAVRHRLIIYGVCASCGAQRTASRHGQAGDVH